MLRKCIVVYYDGNDTKAVACVTEHADSSNAHMFNVLDPNGEVGQSLTELGFNPEDGTPRAEVTINAVITRSPDRDDEIRVPNTDDAWLDNTVVYVDEVQYVFAD